MRNLYLILFSFIVIAVSSCVVDEPTEKPTEPILGCTDSLSINYNLLATIDNGSCEYLSDSYVGIYTAYDTTIHVNIITQESITTIREYTFSIAKIDYNQIELQHFIESGCYTEAFLTENVMELINTPCITTFYDDDFYRENDKIIYKYKYGAWAEEYYARGIAVKQ